MDNTTNSSRYEISYGDKYQATKDLAMAEIAKLVRSDIKAAQKAGQLPKALKVSVRSDYNSLRVEVVSAPFALMSEDGLRASLTGEYIPVYMQRSEEATRVENLLNAIMAAYNYDGSDIQTDYFNVRFYGRAGFDWQMGEAECAAYKAHFGTEASNVIPFRKVVR